MDVEEVRVILVEGIVTPKVNECNAWTEKPLHRSVGLSLHVHYYLDIKVP